MIHFPYLLKYIYCDADNNENKYAINHEWGWQWPILDDEVN